MISFNSQYLNKSFSLPILCITAFFLFNWLGSNVLVAQNFIPKQTREVKQILDITQPETHNLYQDLHFELNPQQGFYTDSVELKLLNKHSGWNYYFNVQGKKPVDWVFPEEGITLKASNVIRILAIQSETQDTVEGFYTYLLNQEPSLPVLSLIFEPSDFFSGDSGIYVKGSNGITGYCRTTPYNWNQDWERPVQMTLFEQDGKTSTNVAFSIPTGVKIGGGCTRLYDQKS